MEKNSEAFKAFRLIAVIGNILFILWMTRNGIHEGFRGTIYQMLSYIGLTFLLILNSVLLYRL